MRFGKAPAWAGSKGARRSGGFFRGASGIFSFAIHYSLNGHIQVDGDAARARWYLFMPCTLAAGNRARWRAGIDHDVRAGRWNLDVPPQAVGAVDERTVRDRLGQNAFRVTGIARGEMIG